MAAVDELAEALRASRRALLQAASGVTPERAVLRPADGQWSVLEVLAHLADVDRHWLTQALAMRNDSSHMFAGFDDAAWKACHADVLEEPLEDVLAALHRFHETVLNQLASMSEEDLDAPGHHPRGIPYTVRDVFLRYPAHDGNHTPQIEQILAAI